MADGVKIESGTPETVAFRLMEMVASVAERGIHETGNPEHLKREYWLKLYAECLSVVKGNDPPSPPSS